MSTPQLAPPSRDPRDAEDVFSEASVKRDQCDSPESCFVSSPGSQFLTRPTFASLFREYFAGVLEAVQRFGVHPRHAEDVAQDVFVAVFKALDRYDPSRPFKPWVKTIAYRLARDSLVLCRTRERLTYTGQIDRVEPTADPEQHLLAKQSQKMLHEVLQSLDADHRTIFLMAEIDQLTQPEIAQALGIPESTVQSRLRRAREDFDSAAYRRRLVEENQLRHVRVPRSQGTTPRSTRIGTPRAV